MPRPEASQRSLSAECACLRLRKASRRVTQIYDRHLEPFGLTVTQYSLLGHLKVFDGIVLGALAEKLVMDPTTLTRTLRPMERQGWVVSTADSRDGRARRLHMTATGLQIYKTAKPGWQQAQTQIAVALGTGENEQLAAGIERLLQKLSD